ncbi:MAG: AlkZ family DNA glycosylase [Candidatus Dormibacteraeota bacterium]|nr:AlkZ family DNA glycosylase [Candidatus Dormibacteraeota bacterium]
MLTLGDEQVRLLRARAQGIADLRREPSAEAVIARCFAVQAQHLPAASLGLRARAGGLSADSVRRALSHDRTLVRGWFMRGTLHLVAAQDARWLQELYGPRELRLSERRYRELGLGPDQLRRGEQAITRALAADGPLTRDQLTIQLANAGLSATGQVPIHLIRRCTLEGSVCWGPLREDGEATFVLTESWIPEQGTRAAGPNGEGAVRELARRYLAAHAPASLADFATWSGLDLPAARTAWLGLADAGLTTDCRVNGEDCVLPTGDVPQLHPRGDIRLLPAYDDYLLGYVSRRLSVPSGRERAVWPGGGQIRATVVADGLVCGVWRRDRRRGVTIELFDDAPGGMDAALEAERFDLLRFGE